MNNRRQQAASRPPDSQPSRSRPGLAAMGSVFARYGNFTFGGGNTTMAILHGVLVTKRRWLSADDFMLCFALARLTPGTNVLAFCTGVGWLLLGWAGAAAALVAASLPSALMVVAATAMFDHLRNNGWAAAAIHGAVAAAVAITVRMCWTIVQPQWKARVRLRVILVAACAFTASAVFGLPPIVVLLLAAGVGAAFPPARA